MSSLSRTPHQMLMVSFFDKAKIKHHMTHDDGSSTFELEQGCTTLMLNLDDEAANRLSIAIAQTLQAKQDDKAEREIPVPPGPQLA